MNIAICDDDLLQLEYICSLVKKWSNNTNGKNKISLYKSAEELLFDYTPGGFDILLLDIQMDGENGISLAKRIRSFNDDAVIIFITAVSDYVFDGYDVGAVQYLLKPVDEVKLFECLNTSRKKSTSQKRIILESEQGSIAVAIDDIIYSEAFSHKTKVVMNDREFFINESISSIEQKLSDDFYKCHRSYIVNIKHINSIKKYDAVMDNGSSIPISRRIYNDFNSAFIAFYRR
ncbi:MAG: LytTR family DNA-binding domain-containing protein [Eubacterium sp.]|nr:LytTR family DNA-binding domain-containing protein [Eubacterium sp.]